MKSLTKTLIATALVWCWLAGFLAVPVLAGQSRAGKLDLAIIIDGSGSMKGHQKELTQAALGIIDELEHGDWIVPLLLSTDPEVLSDREAGEPGILIKDAVAKQRLRSLITGVRPTGQYSYHQGAIRLCVEVLAAFRKTTSSDANPCIVILGDGLMEPGPYGVDVTPERMEELYARYPEARTIPIYLFRIGSLPESSPGKRDITEVLPGLPAFQVVAIAPGGTRGAEAEIALTRISAVLRSFREEVRVRERPAGRGIHLPWGRIMAPLFTALSTILDAFRVLWPVLVAGGLLGAIVLFLKRRPSTAVAEEPPPFETPSEITLEVHQEGEGKEPTMKEFLLTVPPEGQEYVIGSYEGGSDIHIENDEDVLLVHGALRVSGSRQLYYLERSGSPVRQLFRRERRLFNGEEIRLTKRTTIIVRLLLAATAVVGDELLDEATL